MKRLFGYVLIPAVLIVLSGCSATLPIAAMKGDINAVRDMLNQGADVNAKSDTGWTALMWAAHDGHLNIARLLIEKGADVNAKNDTGWTALIFAAWKGHPDVARLLIEKGADVNAKHNNGVTALILAASEGHLDVARLLIEKGADVSAELKRINPKAEKGLAMKNMLIRLEEEYKTAAAQKPGGVAVKNKPFVPFASVVHSDVDELPAVKAKPNKNAYAIVIGIETYRQKLPKADFATHDAQTMTEYLTKVMGYPEENIVTLLNDRATFVDLVKYFEKWLSNNVEKDGSVFIYYSGHGAPNPKTGDAYLVPYDGDPSFIDQTGYSLKRLYESLGKLQAKEIVVALDSCFSGAGGKSVIAKGARPLIMNLEHDIIPVKNMTVLSASSGDQISSSYEEKGHGLFTYFMLKGIKDGITEIGELFEYIKPQVERVARKTYNNEQSPQLIAPEKKKVFLIEKTK